MTLPVSSTPRGHRVRASGCGLGTSLSARWAASRRCGTRSARSAGRTRRPTAPFATGRSRAWARRRASSGARACLVGAGDELGLPSRSTSSLRRAVERRDAIARTETRTPLAGSLGNERHVHVCALDPGAFEHVGRAGVGVGGRNASGVARQRRRASLHRVRGPRDSQSPPSARGDVDGAQVRSITTWSPRFAASASTKSTKRSTAAVDGRHRSNVRSPARQPASRGAQRR